MTWYEMHPAVVRIRELQDEAARWRLAAPATRARQESRRHAEAKSLTATLRRALRLLGCRTFAARESC